MTVEHGYRYIGATAWNEITSFALSRSLSNRLNRPYVHVPPRCRKVRLPAMAIQFDLFLESEADEIRMREKKRHRVPAIYLYRARRTSRWNVQFFSFLFLGKILFRVCLVIFFEIYIGWTCRFLCYLQISPFSNFFHVNVQVFLEKIFIAIYIPSPTYFAN